MTDRVRDLVRDELRALDAYHVPRPTGIRAKLDANEAPWSLPAEVAEALGRELAGVALNRYPASDGGALRAELAALLGVSPSALVIGNGSDELIALLIAAFSRPRPGAARAAVLYPWPSFVYYRIAALAAGVEPVEVPLEPDFTLGAAALERALERRPNLAFFALPNNPTGTLWSRPLVEACLRDHPDMLVVADEAYFDYCGDSMLDLLPAHSNLIVMRTLSKVGLAALRVGYLTAHPAVLHELEKVRPPYNVGSLNQRAAAWLLRHHGELVRSRCAEVVAERARLAAALAELPGVEVFPSRANLILLRIGRPGDGRAGAVWRELAARGVLVRNFDGPPGPLSGCLRVTVGTREEDDLCLSALHEAL